MATEALALAGDSSILNGSCVVLLDAIGGGPQDTCRWRARYGDAVKAFVDLRAAPFMSPLAPK